MWVSGVSGFVARETVRIGALATVGQAIGENGNGVGQICCQY